MPSLAAAFIDVGGVLWSAGVDFKRPAARDERLTALGLDPADAARLREALEAATSSIGTASTFDVLAVTARTLATLGLEALDAEDVRHAMCVPADEAFGQRPDAGSFLATLGRLGLHRTIVSNVTWRSQAEYREDFTRLGIIEHIDAIVSSVDALVRKPNPLIFEAALAAAGNPDPAACVMIGDIEHKDIAPSRALGMRAILMATDRSVETQADGTATTLTEAQALIEAWTG